MEKLHQAARRGQTELVRRLIGAGIPINVPNKFGCTALHLACKNGHVATVKELALKANLSGTWHGRRPLHIAVAGNHKEVVLALLEGAKAQNVAIDSFLAECDEYECQEVGKFRKVCSGQAALHWAVGLQSKDMVQYLLSSGCPVMVRDRNGETPLNRAIEFGEEELFEVLMSARPRFDVTDKYNRNALHWALKHQRLGMAAKLIAAGCDVNQEDTDKATPVLLAAQHANLKLLQQMLPLADGEGFYQLPIHNGKEVLEDRVGFVSGTVEEHVEIVRELQVKLDVSHKDRDNAKGRKTNQGPAIHLAPSAPIKK
jgi:ankyrin repeat protein